MKSFRPQIRSRHHTHAPLRGALPLFPFRSVIRLGSSTATEDIFPRSVQKGLKIVEINTDDAVCISANKLKMKKAFADAGIKTADWWDEARDDSHGDGFLRNSVTGQDVSLSKNEDNDPIVPFPIVAKHIFGSRGTGNHLLHNAEEFKAWVKGKTLKNYIFEKYYSYNKEYRLHTSKDGCFYTCRKMLKEDTPKEKRWFRNDSNSVWIKEDNESFEKPATWDLIVEDCVKALASIGLDFAAFDVRVQSNKHKNKKGEEVINEKPEWIIIESNSAPSFGDVTLEKYLEVLPKLINDKA